MQEESFVDRYTEGNEGKSVCYLQHFHSYIVVSQQYFYQTGVYSTRYIVYGGGDEEPEDIYDHGKSKVVSNETLMK